MKRLVVILSLVEGLIAVARYASAVQCQVSLPQQSTPVCKLMRKAALGERRKTFTLKHDPALHGFALLNMTEEELKAVALQDPFTRYFTIAYAQTTTASGKTFDLYNNINDGEEINSMSEYLEIAAFFSSALEAATGQYARRPSEYEAFIDDKTVWLSDKLFTQQRLAGTNPMSLKRVTIQGPTGLHWKNLKETLNPNFDWDAAVQAALKCDDSLEDAIKQRRIYALRYELCDDMPRSPDLTDKDPRRTVWNSLSPIALFASKVVGDQNRNELVPVAIQMDYKPDSAVYTPKDGDNWTIAKLNVQITDLGYAQIAEHLAKIHYLMEPFCVILKRTMAPLHPLNQILKYHCREVTVPNTFGTPKLVDEAQFMDLLFSHGNTGTMRLLRDAHPLATWDVTDLRAEIKKRGLDDKRLLPYFPYRDDGEVILRVIEHMVKDYVDLYYENDGDVEMDAELQAYVNELSMEGKGPTGGIGRIVGFPTHIDTKKELCGIVSRIISHLSVQHSALNYLLADYAQYIPNQPKKLYNDTRVSEGEFSVYRLPNRLTSAIEASFANSLAAFRFDSLFDYGNELQDSKAGNLVNGYYNHLMEVVQPRMQARNERRKTRGDLTYPYLIPRWLPNGIQT